MAATMTDIEAQVEKGRQWLAEHDSDPAGRFYLWWQMGIRPTDPMPRQPQDVKDRYAQWFKGFEKWLTLYCQWSGENRTYLSNWMHSRAGQQAAIGAGS